jgi:hypothetical protein
MNNAMRGLNAMEMQIRFQCWWCATALRKREKGRPPVVQYYAPDLAGNEIQYSRKGGDHDF